MITAYLYSKDKNQLRKLDEAGVLESRPAHSGAANGNGIKGQSQCRAGELLWVDVCDPTEADYELLTKRFDLHPMVVEDVKGREGRPKVHDYGDYLYIIFHALKLEGTDPVQAGKCAMQLTEIDALLGPDYVITIHDQPVPVFDELCGRWEKTPEFINAGASQLFYELMDEVLDEYFPLLDTLDEQMDELENRLFANYREGLSADIFALKRCLLQIRRVAAPTRDVVNVLLRRDAEAGNQHFAYYQDLYDHTVRIVDMIDTFRDLLSGALDAYLAIQSNRMNMVMKTLTAASIMLLVPNLIAAIYGMNFKYMPELNTRYGYFVVLGVMALCTAGLYVMFKRKDWL